MNTQASGVDLALEQAQRLGETNPPPAVVSRMVKTLANAIEAIVEHEQARSTTSALHVRAHCIRLAGDVVGKMLRLLAQEISK